MPSTRSTKKSARKTDPRRRGNPPSRFDRMTVALAVIALLLLVLVIVFMGRGPIRSARRTGPETAPVIERREPEAAPAAPEAPVVELGTPAEEAAPEAVETVEEPENGVAEDMTVRLFFVRVSGEGSIGMKGVLRPVARTGSPLTAAINSLLDGPRSEELSNDVLSLIPEGSRLLGARVDGGIAFLDFNEEFRFNALGIEGYRAQVEQIVYTATEFPTVDRVQFLVEGQRIDYLGGEGFWVGGPLGREDF